MIGHSVRRRRPSRGMLGVRFFSCPETAQLRIRVVQSPRDTRTIDYTVKRSPSSLCVTIFAVNPNGKRIARMRYRLSFKLNDGHIEQRQRLKFIRPREKTTYYKLPRIC